MLIELQLVEHLGHKSLNGLVLQVNTYMQIFMTLHGMIMGINYYLDVTEVYIFLLIKAQRLETEILV
jgi:hypothetical protein